MLTARYVPELFRIICKVRDQWTADDQTILFKRTVTLKLRMRKSLTKI